MIHEDVARLFFEGVVAIAKQRGLMSAEHFTVDGTLIEAWASLKSFKKRGAKDRTPPDDPGNPTVNFHGEKRSNETHESTTPPEARLHRKGDNHAARLCYSAHVLMENRNGLCVDVRIAEASGYAERREALAMIDEQRRRGVRVETLGASARSGRASHNRSRADVAPTSTDELRGTRATQSVSASESSSRKSSAG